MQVKILKWSGKDVDGELAEFLHRPAVDPKADETARRVLADIRAEGDAAVERYTREFNGVDLKASEFAVPAKTRREAGDAVSPEFKMAVTEILARVTRFAKAGMRQNWMIPAPKGGVLGEQFTPIRRVGVYVPGGAAPLASTVLMTVPLAKAAGVPEIVVCTPSDKEGRVDAHLLHAAEAAGATEVYRVGGIQAIGAMAYGTATIRKVDKIVGPGGPYVTAAKRLTYGMVDLDMVAGPSEIAVLADETADVRSVAADLLSQLEHGSGHEKALLVTSSERVAKGVAAEMERACAAAPRREFIERAAEKGALIVVADNPDRGMDLINAFAPEHFELALAEAARWLPRVKNAGAIFVGRWTPESAGDFVAGPSHVLPTGGTAASFSGLTAESFRKRTSIVSFTRADLQDALPLIEMMGKVEGLGEHSRAGRVRFETGDSAT